jgi:hypothetical protein
MKNRSVERFPLSLPICVRWNTPSGSAEAETRSRNVSSRGIYFFLPSPIEDGSTVEITIALPEESSGSRIHCQGRVRRTEVIEPDQIGVAAQIERYCFERGS